MDPTTTAIGTWSGGRFMHFGEPLDDERLAALLRPGDGIDTVITADAYGAGEADALLGRALAGVPRDDYCLVGAIGHDFYEGEREGAKGFPRFTDPRLRGRGDYADYLRMADRAQPRALRRRRASTCCCCTTPTAPATRARRCGRRCARCATAGLTRLLGVAPGPGERLHARPDRLLRALRRADRLGDDHPQPARAVAGRAGARRRPRAHDVNADHARGRLRRPVPRRRAARATRSPSTTTAASAPTGWVEAGREQLERMRPIAERHGLTMLQLACAWNLAHAAGAVRGADADPGERRRTRGRSRTSAPSWPPCRRRVAARAPRRSRELRAIGDNTRLDGAEGRERRTRGRARCRPLGARRASSRRVAARWEIDPRRDLRRARDRATANDDWTGGSA